MLGRRSASLVLALTGGLLIGLGYPFIDLAIACRMPTSEACVWGKAYFPLTLAMSVLLLGGATGGLLYLGLMWRRRPAPKDDVTEP